MQTSGKLPAELPANSGKLRVMSHHCHTHTNFQPIPNPAPSSLTLFCVIVPFPSSSVPIVPSFIILSSIVSSLLFPVLLSHDSFFLIPYISTLSCMYLTCSNIDLHNHCLLDSLSLLVIVSSTLNSALPTSKLCPTS